ncbi:Anti-repressor SinI [Fictibacillus enclensis]|uniref:anti-repressor SinI family protein n=1 Tax=Fictibacillus enclensis TaxID=1017270 RepID=UPI000815CC9D|nr:anti-repressor SinI family protein [Fictibacillus enclensis]SCC15674.1 Anti-repressor SinI [Fictibacillus enclensis]
MTSNEHLDQEWIHLILQAKKMGLSIEEVRLYLRKTYITPPAKTYIKERSL